MSNAVFCNHSRPYNGALAAPTAEVVAGFVAEVEVVTGLAALLVVLLVASVVGTGLVLVLAEVEGMAIAVRMEEVAGVDDDLTYRLARCLHQSLIIQTSKSVMVVELPASITKLVIPLGVQS